MIKKFSRSVRFLITKKDNQIQKIIKNDKKLQKIYNQQIF